MNPVKWTKGHLQELEKAFPELLDTSDVNKLILSTGKRTVVDYVKVQLLHQEKRLNAEANKS